MLSYNELSRNPVKFLALTGYTVEEVLALLPHFRSQFEATMKAKTLDDKPRFKRRYTDYRNSPLPTIEDKLLFILVYLKQGAIQEVHASLFGMHQPDANQWIHLLHPILNQTLSVLSELPVRKADDLGRRQRGRLFPRRDGAPRATAQEPGGAKAVLQW
jgi:hypothetical protein